jgi:hypothetical protein
MDRREEEEQEKGQRVKTNNRQRERTSNPFESHMTLTRILLSAHLTPTVPV